MAPRVSIMVPAYNAARTLPLAFASMAAQTLEDWEAIIVDDGSTDGTAETVAAFVDPRVVSIRLPANRGRPHARHVALEAARGEYLAMLDADDWMYPERLAKQVAVFAAYVDVAAVSAGMAVTDEQGNMLGARSFAAGPRVSSGVYAAPGRLPVAHGPSMLRRELIGDLRPDLRLARGQDTDFLMRFLDGRRYVLLPELLYAYSEASSFNHENVLLGHRLKRVVQAKYFRTHPIRARLNWCSAYAKGLACRLLFASGRGEYVLRSRSRSPSAEQAASYEAARRLVLERLAQLPPVQNRTVSPSGFRTDVRSPI